MINKDIEGYTPLPENVYIDKSPIHGIGIYAKVDIPKGHDFGITHVKDERFPNGLIRTSIGGFVNHSHDPSLKMFEVDDTVRMKTIKAIKKDEELVIDYSPYYTQETLDTYN